MKIFGKKDEGIFTTRMLTTITDIIVKKYIKAGYIAPENYEDTRQTIIEKYIAKRERIESLYDKRAKPETYLSAVLYKMMLEIMRSTSSKQKHFGEYEATVLKNGEGHQITPEEKLIIENEKKYLEKVLASFGHETSKVTLFCKMFFRIRPTKQELEAYLKHEADNDILKLTFIEGNELDKEIFDRLCTICNTAENKNNKPDAVRMFVGKTNGKIINRLNLNRQTNYNEESLALLFDMVYTDKDT